MGIMIYISLNSSCIERVGYNPLTRQMEVEFTNSRTYTLTGVPEYHFYGIVNATSAGRYWNENLKGRY